MSRFHAAAPRGGVDGGVDGGVLALYDVVTTGFEGVKGCGGVILHAHTRDVRMPVFSGGEVKVSPVRASIDPTTPHHPTRARLQADLLKI